MNKQEPERETQEPERENQEEFKKEKKKSKKSKKEIFKDEEQEEQEEQDTNSNKQEFENKRKKKSKKSKKHKKHKQDADDDENESCPKKRKKSKKSSTRSRSRDSLVNDHQNEHRDYDRTSRRQHNDSHDRSRRSDSYSREISRRSRSRGDSRDDFHRDSKRDSVDRERERGERRRYYDRDVMDDRRSHYDRDAMDDRRSHYDRDIMDDRGRDYDRDRKRIRASRSVSISKSVGDSRQMSSELRHVANGDMVQSPIRESPGVSVGTGGGRERERDRERVRVRVREEDRDRERVREGDRDRERVREGERDRDREGDRDRVRERDKKDRDRERDKKDRDRERDKKDGDDELQIMAQTQGSVEEAKLAADNLRQLMEIEIEKRREKQARLEKWKETQRKEGKLGEVEETGLNIESNGQESKWNLEDDEDDEEGVGVVSANIESTLPVSMPKLKPVILVKKRSLLVGVKKAAKKNAIGFGLRAVERKTVGTGRRMVLEEEEGLDDVQEEKDVFVGKDQNGIVDKVEDGQEYMNVDFKAVEMDANRVKQGDALDMFMLSVHSQVEKKTEQDKVALTKAKQNAPNAVDLAKALEDVPTDDELDLDAQEEESFPLNVLATSSVEINQAEIFALAAAKAAAKKKDLPVVDHSKISYEEFRKDFYKEPPELSRMTKKEVDELRKDLDGIHVRGKACPKPVQKWTQFGMPLPALEVIRKVLKYEIPSPIQAQAIPAIMNGRDVIGIAKTGSGKTIAFLVPMLRHIKDQRPSQGMEGPIGIVMTPTRELALQIYKECKTFTKVMGLRVACCYGGSPIGEQIAELKRGADIIICTPGRMIDLLCSNGGRVTNLKRVTFLVLDEADRMFDLGFEPQVMKMVNNIRPDRQTVLFSATFPRFMEGLARKILIKPLEIIVGARSVVASGVTQIVEVHQDDGGKFLRLLAILGKTTDEEPNAKFLIFVDRQESADTMMANLMKRGYPCLSLHGGKDQADRDSVISDFKGITANILVATSVAARGLDVKDLKVVVNYECPNHLEDYVHRCGRTGRAGNTGAAYTFIRPDQASYAAEIVKSLVASKAPVSAELQELVDKHDEKVQLGFARKSGSGFGGRGLKRLEGNRDNIRLIQYHAHGGVAPDPEKENGDEEVDSEGLPLVTTTRSNSGVDPISASTDVQATSTEKSQQKAIEALKQRASKINSMLPHERVRFLADSIAKGRAAMAQRVQTDAACWAEVEVNDYPQKARWKVTSKEQISRISALANAAITSRGVYIPPGKASQTGERKLYLFIEADNQHCVERAKQEIKELLTEATMSAALDEKTTIGRYSVI